ncbi:MAG: protein kinase [Myxococcales bacterium]|nr:protein kinase [Myxococcales bacterium]
MTKKVSDTPTTEESHVPKRAARNPNLAATWKMDMEDVYAEMMKVAERQQGSSEEPKAPVSPPPSSAPIKPSIAMDQTLDEDDEDAATIFSAEFAKFAAQVAPPQEAASSSETLTTPQPRPQTPSPLFSEDDEIDPFEGDQTTIAASPAPGLQIHSSPPNDPQSEYNDPLALQATMPSVEAVPAEFADAYTDPNGSFTPTNPQPIPIDYLKPLSPAPQAPQQTAQAVPQTVFAQQTSNPFESTLDKPIQSPLLKQEPPPPADTTHDDDDDDDYEDSGSLFGMSTMGGYLAKLFGVGKIGEFLRNLAIFEGMGRTSLMRLSQKVKVQKYEPNQVIMRRGQQGDSMFILAQGDVQVLLRQDTAAGETLRMIPLHVGDVFGEMGLLTGNPRNADIVSISKSVCLELQKRDVEALCAQHPPISRFLTAILGERLRSTHAIKEVGRIQIIKEIGAGATAFVYAARLKNGGQPVALKMLSHELAYDKTFRQRFLEEARILAQLRHPHIVQFYGTEEAYATVFLVMEMVEGSNLDAYLEQKHRFSYEECRRMLLETASALHYAHENGIIHRDIKPANLLMDRNKHIKVTDFGLAVQPTKDEDFQSTQKPEGSPSYMAPEQIMWQPVDRRADIYALGITAFKMLTGTLPFQGSIDQIFQQHVSKPIPDLHKYDPNIPPKLVAFIQKATAKAKKERFQTCQEILQMLS